MKKLIYLFTLLLLNISTYAQVVLSSAHNNASYTAPHSIILNTGFSASPTSGQSFTASIVLDDNQSLGTKPDSNKNYIITYVPRVAGLVNPADTANTTRQVMVGIQYMDGLGRPVQNTQVKGSPYGSDVVQSQAYDKFGRESVKYEPYAASTYDGSYKSSAITDQGTFYGGGGGGIQATSYPYAVTNFEMSADNGRPTAQGAPGADWQPGSHPVKLGYGISDTAAIRLWTVASNGNGAATSSYYYGDAYGGALSADTVTDENGHRTITYKDQEGHVTNKKVQSGSGAYLITTYIYDDFGNLAYVIPPLNTTAPTSFAESDTLFTRYMYAYHYDGRHRVTEKHVPNKGWEYMVYNDIDKVVATQDSVQKGNNIWTYTKYDALGRTIQSGTWDNNNTAISRSSLQSSVTGNTYLWEIRASGGGVYTNNAWPTSHTTLLTMNYYDNYSSTYLASGNAIPGAYSAPAGASTATTGLLTATRTAILNNPSDMLWTVHYYDDYGRVIQSYAQHYLGGSGSYSTNNYDQVTNTYDFTNAVVTTTRKHYTSGGGSTPIVTLKDSMVYDHMGRLTQNWNKINTGTNVLMSQTDYNEIGQAKAKHLHSEDGGSTYLQDQAYAYNERGWLRTSTTSGNLFNLDLRYNNPNSGTAQYNGNIAEQNYYGTNSGSKVFDYTYDYLNRLTAASSTSGTLNESIGYDNLGNITGLTRGGQSYNALSYAYTGSQLTGVTGTSFTTRSYSYDANGNATSDGGSKVIDYNILNLPQDLKVSGTAIANYYYDAAGQKVRTTSTADGNWDYISGIVYHAGSLTYITTPEGRITYNGSVYKYQYDLKDHLGNVRVTFDKGGGGSAEVMQEDEYYSFGLRKGLYDNSNDNRHLYNGKEIQVDLANQYDYGARFYDPVIGRWSVIDHKAELYFQYSPYVYAANTPVNAIDPDGHLVIFVNGNYFDGSGGTRRYWQTYTPVGGGAMLKLTQDFAGGVMDKLGDHHALYVNGAGNYIKGYNPISGLLSPHLSGMNASDRYDGGYRQGSEEAAAVIESLHRTGGVIDESIKVITHSMGGAYGKGYIEAIMDYAKKNNIAGVNVAFEADFAPFQTGQQQAVKGVKTFQYSHKEMIAGDDPIKGENQMDTSQDKDQSHDISSFMNDIQNLPTGNYKIVDGKIVKDTDKKP